MFVLGHVGLTLYAARAVDPELDWKPAAALAVAPDALDKPLAWLWPSLVNENTRGFGHTFLAWLLVLAALGALAKPLRLRRPWLLWGCFAGHAVLDLMWTGRNPEVFLWPLLGGFPPPLRSGPLEFHTYLYNLAGEAAGAALLLRLWRLKKKEPRPCGPGSLARTSDG